MADERLGSAEVGPARGSAEFGDRVELGLRGRDRRSPGIHVGEIALLAMAVDLELAEGRRGREERDRSDRGHQDHGQAAPSRRQTK